MTAGLSLVAGRAAKSPAIPVLPDDHHDCTLCWAASVSGASVVPDWPAVVLSPVARHIRFVASHNAAPRRPAEVNFFARGPPPLAHA